MSPDTPPSREGSPEDFDPADDEFPDQEESILLCDFCGLEIVDRYHELEGWNRVVCDSCREKFDASLQPKAEGAARFFRATTFGILAGIGGCLLYFAFLKLFHRQTALIAILLGYVVGKAVSKGSRERGGWVYQTLAVFLAYSAIAWSQAAAFLPGAIERFQQRQAEQRKLAPVEPAQQPAPAPAPRPTLLKLGIQMLFLGGVALRLIYVMPFLGGPITLIIIFLALRRAWTQNRRSLLTFRGPYSMNEFSPVN